MQPQVMENGHGFWIYVNALSTTPNLYIAYNYTLNNKSRSARLAEYGLLEKANAFSSCDAYAAEAFLVERFD